MANPWTPPANLGDRASSGYPSRRTLPQPDDNPGAYAAPPAPPLPESLQFTAAAPPRPSAVSGPAPAHFQPGTIPGESGKNARSRG